MRVWGVTPNPPAPANKPTAVMATVPTRWTVSVEVSGAPYGDVDLPSWMAVPLFGDRFEAVHVFLGSADDDQPRSGRGQLLVAEELYLRSHLVADDARRVDKPSWNSSGRATR